MTILLLACCKKKSGAPRARARDLYQGAMFRLGMQLAQKRGWTVYILSAKYGWIDPNDVIADYDTRFKKRYAGIWPPGSGFYIGGQDYFGNAPHTFKPLVPNARGIGHWLQGIKAELAK